jgi:heat shock protein HtpX
LDFAARQARNQRWSAALVAAFILFFLLIGGAIDYLYFDGFTEAGPALPIATIFSLGLATASTLAAYYGGGDMILSSLGAQKLNPQNPEQRELQNIVTEMALASGSAMPRLFVIFDPAPNAFATGTNEKNAAICVTSGLLTLLDREETQGVIAHEISHIRNEDVLLMTLVSILLGGIAVLADWGRRGFYSARTGRRLGKKNLLLFIPVLVLIALSPLIARLLAMAVSRQREYLADATAAQYTRNPRGLAQALEKIRGATMPFHRATRGTAHLFFINPLSRRVDGRDGRLADWFASHPPIERRISLLYRMAGLERSAPQSAKAPAVQ